MDAWRWDMLESRVVNRIRCLGWEECPGVAVVVNKATAPCSALFDIYGYRYRITRRQPFSRMLHLAFVGMYEVVLFSRDIEAR